MVKNTMVQTYEEATTQVPSLHSIPRSTYLLSKCRVRKDREKLHTNIITIKDQMCEMSKKLPARPRRDKEALSGGSAEPPAATAATAVTTAAVASAAAAPAPAAAPAAASTDKVEPSQSTEEKKAARNKRIEAMVKLHRDKGRTVHSYVGKGPHSPLMTLDGAAVDQHKNFVMGVYRPIAEEYSRLHPEPQEGRALFLDPYYPGRELDEDIHPFVKPYDDLLPWNKSEGNRGDSPQGGYKVRVGGIDKVFFSRAKLGQSYRMAFRLATLQALVYEKYPPPPAGPQKSRTGQETDVLPKEEIAALLAQATTADQDQTGNLALMLGRKAFPAESGDGTCFLQIISKLLRIQVCDTWITNFLLQMMITEYWTPGTADAGTSYETEIQAILAQLRDISIWTKLCNEAPYTHRAFRFAAQIQGIFERNWSQLTRYIDESQACAMAKLFYVEMGLKVSIARPTVPFEHMKQGDPAQWTFTPLWPGSPTTLSYEEVKADDEIVLWIHRAVHYVGAVARDLAHYQTKDLDKRSNIIIDLLAADDRTWVYRIVTAIALQQLDLQVLAGQKEVRRPYAICAPFDGTQPWRGVIDTSDDEFGHQPHSILSAEISCSVRKVIHKTYGWPLRPSNKVHVDDKGTRITYQGDVYDLLTEGGRTVKIFLRDLPHATVLALVTGSTCKDCSLAATTGGVLGFTGESSRAIHAVYLLLYLIMEHSRQDISVAIIYENSGAIMDVPRIHFKEYAEQILGLTFYLHDAANFSVISRRRAWAFNFLPNLTSPPRDILPSIKKAIGLGARK